MSENNNNSLKRLRIKQFIPGIAWFLLVTTLLFTPGNDLPQIDFIGELNLDKLIHTTLFGILTTLFCLPFKKSTITREERIKWFIRIAIATSVWGITTEIIQQNFIPNRSFEWMDWGADSFGAICGYLFSRKFFTKMS